MKNWKDIPGYEGLYKISDDGLIKSLEKKWVTGRGKGRHHTQPEKIIKDFISKFGYRRVALYKNNSCKKFHVHTLVALSFCPGWFKNAQPNHIDGNKLNNNYLNLEWITVSQNAKHAYFTGLRIISEKHKLIISDLHKGEKNINAVKVLDTATGKIYNTIKDASEAFYIKPHNLYAYLKGRNPNPTTLKYA